MSEYDQRRCAMPAVAAMPLAATLCVAWIASFAEAPHSPPCWRLGTTAEGQTRGCVDTPVAKWSIDGRVDLHGNFDVIHHLLQLHLPGNYREL